VNRQLSARSPLSLDTTAVFCHLHMLQSSLAYTGRLGALVGVAVLLVGVPLLLLAQRCMQILTQGEKMMQFHAHYGYWLQYDVAILELADASTSPDYGSSEPNRN